MLCSQLVPVESWSVDVTMTVNHDVWVSPGQRVVPDDFEEWDQINLGMVTLLNRPSILI
jgi:hypothetical protein